MASHQARFLRNAGAAVADTKLQLLLEDVTERFTSRRVQAIETVPEWEALREHARRVKDHTQKHLDRYLVEFESRVLDAGGRVFWASTVDDARNYVRDLAVRRGVTHVVKSKSMVTEEIKLNDCLSDAGIESIETDFGEYIIQLAGEAPSHIIAPAIHKSRGDVGKLFAEKLGLPLTDDVEVLAATARRRLRREFGAAGMGISGANFAVAESGTLVVVENEGNARLVTSVPPIHVAVVGIEKIVPTTDDLAVFLQLLPRSATGQRMTSYVSLITGPRRPGEVDGPEELHVVLLDNGRTTILANQHLREVLRCIRCGACQNACPVYRNVGGHAYGGVYAGPIGAIVSSHLEPARTTPDLPFVSTLCGACAAVCPVKIDIPKVLLHLRHQVMEGRIPDERLAGRRGQRLLLRAWAQAMRTSFGYRALFASVRGVLRVLERYGGRRVGPLGRWTDSRDLPAAPKRSFQSLWRSGAVGGAPSDDE